MLFPNISHYAFVYHTAYNIVSIDYLCSFRRILAYASINIYLYVPIHVNIIYITYIDQLLPGQICKCWQQIIFYEMLRITST